MVDLGCLSAFATLLPGCQGCAKICQNHLCLCHLPPRAAAIPFPLSRRRRCQWKRDWRGPRAGVQEAEQGPGFANFETWKPWCYPPCQVGEQNGLIVRIPLVNAMIKPSSGNDAWKGVQLFAICRQKNGLDIKQPQGPVQNRQFIATSSILMEKR